MKRLAEEVSVDHKMMNDLDSGSLAPGVLRYVIPHIVIRAPQTVKNKKPAFSLRGNLLRVEDFAQQLLEDNGYTVFKGDDAHLFFSILSFNFKNSFFLDVCKNLVGQDADKHLATLDVAVSKCIAESCITEELISQAELVLMMYYSSYPPKKEIHSALSEQVRRLDQDIVLSLVRFYRQVEYTTKGAPDLFAVRNSSFYFVEVKSQTDSLSAAQYDFFEGFLNMVGENILVLRVLPQVI